MVEFPLTVLVEEKPASCNLYYTILNIFMQFDYSVTVQNLRKLLFAKMSKLVHA